MASDAANRRVMRDLLAPCKDTRTDPVFAASRRSNQPKILGLGLWKHTFELCRIQAPQPSKHAAEQAAVIVEHGEITVLLQGRLRHFYLLAGDATAGDAAAQHPVHRTVAVVGAAIAVLAEGAAELGD